MRDLYLLDETVTFLNHGSFGACPIPVFDKYQAWQRDLERQPVEFLGRRYEDLMQVSLQSLAKFIGTDWQNLMYSTNATAALNAVARSLDLSTDDEILTTDHEYGALQLTWQYISRETGCNVIPMPLPEYFDNPDEVVEAIWSGVTPNTKILFLSHITSVTALILPVAELCQRARQQGIITIIDGAHVPGHLPLNLDQLGADFYSGNCHKWLSAPKGAAFLYVNPEYHTMLDPLVISWGWDGETLFERTRWQGTRDIAAYLTVPDAIQFQHDHNWQSIQKQCHDLAISTMHRICEISKKAPLATEQFFGQMVAAPLPDTIQPEKLKAQLYEVYRIEVPLTQHNNRHFVRVSFQAYNTQQDADKLLDALQTLL